MMFSGVAILETCRTIVRVRYLTLILMFTAKLSFAQYSLDYFLEKAVANSPVLNDYQNMRAINQVQRKLSRAENAAFQVSLTGDYLFTPYFHNHGDWVTTDPSPGAIGYDINLFDGGLYSAQINVERNLLNGKLLRTLRKQVQIQDRNSEYGFGLEKHNLQQEVTAQYLLTRRLLLRRELAKDVVANLQQQLSLTGELLEEGYKKIQDYLLLKIELRNQTIDLNDNQQQYKTNLLQLYSLCGMRDTTLVEISPASLHLASSATGSNFTQKYVLDSLTTVNQQTLFETKYRPQVKAFFNTGLNAVALQNIQRKFGLSAGVNLSLPLLDGNQKDLTRQQSLIKQKTISEYRQYAERNIELQRRKEESTIHSLQKNLTALTEQVQDYETLLKISAQQLQQGNLSMIDYLTLLRNFTELRKNKIDMEINFQQEINNYNYWNW